MGDEFAKRVKAGVLPDLRSGAGGDRSSRSRPHWLGYLVYHDFPVDRFSRCADANCGPASLNASHGFGDRHRFGHRIARHDRDHNHRRADIAPRGNSSTRLAAS